MVLLEGAQQLMLSRTNWPIVTVALVMVLGGCKTVGRDGVSSGFPERAEDAYQADDGAGMAAHSAADGGRSNTSSSQEAGYPLANSPTGKSPPTSAESALRGSPVLKIGGVQPEQGPLRVAVFSDPASFPKHELASSKTVVDSASNVVEAALNAAPDQSFAVAVFQDVNNDGVLNRSAWGIPSEPYGFSRNASGKFGPPSFGDAAIKPGEASAIDIMLR